MSPEQRPIVAHCSAGVGRSGTMIAIDRSLQGIRKFDVVDIFGIVYEMRKERVWMVQTEQQYICIHQVTMKCSPHINTIFNLFFSASWQFLRGRSMIKGIRMRCMTMKHLKMMKASQNLGCNMSYNLKCTIYNTSNFWKKLHKMIASLVSKSYLWLIVVNQVRVFLPIKIIVKLTPL